MATKTAVAQAVTHARTHLAAVRRLRAMLDDVSDARVRYARTSIMSELEEVESAVRKLRRLIEEDVR